VLYSRVIFPSGAGSAGSNVGTTSYNSALYFVAFSWLLARKLLTLFIGTSHDGSPHSPDAVLAFACQYRAGKLLDCKCCVLRGPMICSLGDYGIHAAAVVATIEC
jgi:hypothetical protein